MELIDLLVLYFLLILKWNEMQAKHVHDLNATSATEVGSLDYDVIINAYDKINVDFFYTVDEDQALVILSHCVYDMSS